MTDNLHSDATFAPYFLTSADFDVLSLEGIDATRFLQGQLTCDVVALPVGGCSPGAALTNKGRAYALFWLLKLSEEHYVFVLNAGVGEILTTQLRKYLPFYKCKFNTEHGGEVLLTVGAASNASVGTSFVLGAEPLATLYWLPNGTDASALTEGLSQGEARRWLTDAMLLGHFPFLPSDVELYTPQEMRLDEHGYVNYEKGCYTGQEIVARMHYRGKVKKVLCRLEIDDLVDASAVTIRDDAGADIGSVFKAMPLGGARWRALAFLPVEALEAATPPSSSAGRLTGFAPL